MIAASGQDTGLAIVLAGKPRSLWGDAWQRLRRNRLSVIGAVILLMLVLVALFAEVIAPSSYEIRVRDPVTKRLIQNQPPSAEHWFGTDELGRDQFTRIIYAGRISLVIGLSVAIVSTIVGAAIGAMAGYFGGWADQLLMRFTDLFLVVHQLAVLLLVQKRCGGSVVAIVIELALLCGE